MLGLIGRHNRVRRETFDSKGDWIHRIKCTISRKKNAASIGRGLRHNNLQIYQISNNQLRSRIITALVARLTKRIIWTLGAP